MSRLGEVARVKRHEFGIVIDPITVTPQMKVRDAIALQRQHGISGLPGGRRPQGGRHRHQPRPALRSPPGRVYPHHHDPAGNAWSRCARAPRWTKPQHLMHKHRLERVLIVNDAFELRGLATVKDIVKNTAHPQANKDAHGQLRVGAAVGVGAGTEERVEKLVAAGVDVIVVDTAHGHSQGVLEGVRWVKKNYPKVDVIGGNIATAERRAALMEYGADGVKVGIGPGSICTTRVVAGVGVPQITAISDVAKALEGTGVPLIADGGIRYSGDVAKALAAGAFACMMGGMFAGTEEAPARSCCSRAVRTSRTAAWAALGAMADGSADRYFQDPANNADKLVPEGIEGRVPYKGSVLAIIYQLAGGVRASMGYCGCAYHRRNAHQDPIRADHLGGLPRIARS